MRKAFRTADRILTHESVRFVIAGGSAAALFYLTTVLFIELGIAAFPATLSAYAVAFVMAYTVQHTWTFRGRQAHRRSFPRYLLAQAAAAVTAGTAAHVCAGSGAPSIVVAAVSTLSGSALSFILSKFWVFARKPVTEAAGA